MKYLSILFVACLTFFSTQANAQAKPKIKTPVLTGKCTSTINVPLKGGKLYNPTTSLSRKASYRVTNQGMVISARKTMKDKDLQWMVFPFKSSNPNGKIVGLRFKYSVKPSSRKSKKLCFISQSRIAQGTVKSKTVRLDDKNNLYAAKNKTYATRAFKPFKQLGNNHKEVAFRLAMTPKDVIIIHKVEVLIECPKKDLCDLKYQPKLIYKGAEKSVVRGNAFTRYKIAISNYSNYPSALFKAAPHLPACGKNGNSSRTWVDIVDQNGKKLYGFCAFGQSADLKKLWFSIPQGKKAPKAVRVKITDRECKKVYVSNLIKIPLKKIPVKKDVKINKDMDQ